MDVKNQQREEEYIFGVYNQIITPSFLPDFLYLNTGEKLMSGVFQGYGGDFTDFVFGKSDYVILEQLHNNIYKFSAAKTFNQTLDTDLLRLDKKGVLKSFDEFKKDAKKIYNIYNETWLETEFNTAIAQANSAAHWKQIEEEKSILPLLTYVTARDEAVRELHAQFDGITRPVGDEFWNTAMPPLDYNCRCIVTQHTEETAKKTPKKYGMFEVNRPGQKTISEKKLKDQIGEEFKFNPGKEKIVFKDKGRNMHPYFKVPQKYHLYREQNFGLKIPKHD